MPPNKFGGYGPKLLAMILAFDVYYIENKAKSVCIQFDNWADEIPINTISEIIEGIEDYEPGAFYKRELPCILHILDKLNLEYIEAIIVDGYVVLDDDGRPGLGAYLYESMSGKTPVMGVAKTHYFNNKNLVKEVFRGVSKKPLYVTAKGMDLDEAADKIRGMNGEFRMPTLLRYLDQTTKEPF